MQNDKRADFTDDSGGQPVHVFGVISDDEELVAKLGEVGLDALAHLPVYGGEGLGVLLFGAQRGLDADVGRLEQVDLHHSTNLSLVAYDAAVVALQFDTSFR